MLISPRSIMVSCVCLVISNVALAIPTETYSDATSDMSHQLDWRIRHNVKEVLRTENGTDIPQINSCYRATNIENEMRKIYDLDNHQNQREAMNGVSVATYEGAYWEEGANYTKAVVQSIPDRIDDPDTYDHFKNLLGSEQAFTRGDNGEDANQADVIITAEKMKQFRRWCADDDKLGEFMDPEDLGSARFMKYFGMHESAIDYNGEHLSDLAIGPHNQDAAQPEDIVKNGHSTSATDTFIASEVIQDDLTEIADLISYLSGGPEVENLPFSIDYSDETSVFRYPTVTRLRNHSFDGCTTGSNWDHFLYGPDGEPNAQNMLHWPNRWCLDKKGETYFHPKHSLETPICECMDQFETFDIEGTDLRGVKLDPWGFKVASIKKNDFQSDWIVEYKLYMENHEADPTSVRVLLRLPDGTFSGLLDLEPTSDPSIFKGTTSIRSAFNMGFEDRNPIFNQEFTPANPGQISLIAVSSNPDLDNAHILTLEVEPGTDKSQRVYCGLKRLAKHSSEVNQRVRHITETDITEGVGGKVTSWIVSADDATSQLRIGNQVSLMLGGQEVRSSGTGGEMNYRLDDPTLTAASDVMGYDSFTRFSISVPVFKTPFFETQVGNVIHISRHEGVAPAATGTLETFTTGQENWLSSTSQSGITVKATGGWGPAELTLRADGRVGGYAEAQSETILTSFSQPRMEQPSHEELSVTYRRFGWFNWPVFSWETVLDPIEPALEDVAFDTITLQHATRTDSGVLLTFDPDLLWRIMIWGGTIDLPNLNYEIPLAEGYGHGSMMLTNQRDYIRSTGLQENFSFLDQMSDYDGLACIEEDSSNVSSMANAYNGQGMIQEAMSETEMLDCFDGDLTSWRPEPNDPTEWSGLFSGWVTTIDEVLESLTPGFVCMKSKEELYGLGVGEDQIFLHPTADPSNEEIYDPTYTDKYCTVVMIGEDGSYIFPSSSDSLSSEWCMMWDAEECPMDECQLLPVNIDGEIVDECRPLE